MRHCVYRTERNIVNDRSTWQQKEFTLTLTRSRIRVWDIFTVHSRPGQMKEKPKRSLEGGAQSLRDIRHVTC